MVTAYSARDPPGMPYDNLWQAASRVYRRGGARAACGMESVPKSVIFFYRWLWGMNLAWPISESFFCCTSVGSNLKLRIMLALGSWDDLEWPHKRWSSLVTTVFFLKWLITHTILSYIITLESPLSAQLCHGCWVPTDLTCWCHESQLGIGHNIYIYDTFTYT